MSRAGHSSPLTYLHAIGGKLRPGVPTVTGCPTCGSCGAPLLAEPDALVVTCDYCLADSWVATLSDAHLAGIERERANLHDLVAALKFRAFDTWLFVVVSLAVAGGFLLALWLGFSR